jgi:hypothetical protein
MFQFMDILLTLQKILFIGAVLKFSSGDGSNGILDCNFLSSYKIEKRAAKDHSEIGINLITYN